jgi:hypothetical protein
MSIFVGRMGHLSFSCLPLQTRRWYSRVHRRGPVLALLPFEYTYRSAGTIFCRIELKLDHEAQPRGSSSCVTGLVGRRFLVEPPGLAVGSQESISLDLAGECKRGAMDQMAHVLYW